MLARKTKRLRHLCVKLVAPTVYYASLPVRPMTEFMQRYFNRPVVGCEIGVELGLNARAMLQYLPIKKLILIDPWKPYFDRDEHKLKHAELFFEPAKTNLSDFKEKTVFIRKTSVDAVNDVPELDFCYVDGDHKLKRVQEDIRLYWRKIKRKGVFGGHDYPYFTGVQKAVDEFVETEKLKLHHCIADWWVVKP